MKFLHTADIHLDSPLLRLDTYEGAPVAEIRNASRRAFEKLIELALAEAVDFVLIAGDLFDGEWKDYNTGLFFVRQVRRLAEARIPVVIISGNHDAASQVTAELPLPDQVTLLGHKKPATLILDRLRVAIHGQSYSKPTVSENLAAAYPSPLAGYFNIGLLHTSLTGRDGHEPYAPCTVADLIAKGYDYWALGHVHGFEMVSAAPPVVFPGCIQGRHIRESGAKGCVLVTVDVYGTPILERRELDVVRWARVVVDVSGCITKEQCLDRWCSALAETLGEHQPLPVVVRVEFGGSGVAHQLLNADPDCWQQAVRAAALSIGGERAWIEKVVLATRIGDSLGLGDPAGPMPEISQYLQALRSDRFALSEFVQRQLNELFRKLPPEVCRSDGTLLWDDAAAMDKLLDQALAMLVQRLQSEEPLL